MAKKMRKLFAIVMILMFCVGQIAMPAMAAETEEAAPVVEAAAASEATPAAEVHTVDTTDVTPAAVEITASTDSSLGMGRDHSTGTGNGNGNGNGQGQGQDNDHGHDHGNGNGNGTTPDADTSVDHIDINVDAGGTVVLNGEEYYVDIGVDKEDAENVTITNEGMEGYTDMSISGEVSTSTDANGESQIRIEGSFDIGTMENPTDYTVQLVKNATVGEGENAQEITVTLSTTTDYWDLDNLCPGLWMNGTPNSKWQEGMYMGDQTGIDLQLQPSGASGGNTSEDISKGQLTIQKTVIGVESGLSETTQFYFDVTDESGNVIYNDVPVTVGAGQTVGILVIENVEFGTYTIIEIVNEDTQIDGYDLETTYNLLGGVEGNVVIITKENDEGWVNVNNIYTEQDDNDDNDDNDDKDPDDKDPDDKDPDDKDPDDKDPDDKDPDDKDPDDKDPDDKDPDDKDPDDKDPDDKDPDDNDDDNEADVPNTPVIIVINGEIEIPDEEVPLANAPKTGDISLIWVVLSGLSAGGMMVLNHKRED